MGAGRVRTVATYLGPPAIVDSRDLSSIQIPGPRVLSTPPPSTGGKLLWHKRGLDNGLTCGCLLITGDNGPAFQDSETVTPQY